MDEQKCPGCGSIHGCAEGCCYERDSHRDLEDELMDERSGGCGRCMGTLDNPGHSQIYCGKAPEDEEYEPKIEGYLCPACAAKLEAELRGCTKQCVDTLARESKLKAENAKLVARDEVWAERWGKIDQVLFEVMDAHYSASLPQYLLDEVEDSLEIAMKDIESELPLDEEGET